MPSPICEVKDGAGAYVSTTNGVDVTSGNTIVIRLADPNADQWDIRCITTDDGNVAETVQAGLTIDALNKTASFTAPVAGASLRFRSRVQGGIGPDGRAKPSYTTTFCVYTLVAGLRTVAMDETTEGGEFGWIGSFNEVVRNGGGIAAVADDISKSAGTIIDRVIGIKGVALETGDTLGTGEVWLKRGGGTTLRAGKPVPPGHFDPKDYGAKFDGVTDDLPALQAMHTAMPSTGGAVLLPEGIAWLSDTWRISKGIRLVGIGGTGNSHSGFEVAPGRTAISLDGSTTSLDGNDAGHHVLQHIDLKSHILVHGSATGSALGYGIDKTHSPSLAVRKGDLLVKNSEVSPTRCFRAQNAGTMGASQPAWSTTPGASLVDSGITWITETLPTVRANLTAYVVGERVYADLDNRFIFVCSTAGTSDAAPPAAMVGGDAAPGVEIGSFVTDGSAVWTVTLAVGIYVRSGLGKIEKLSAAGFTGAAVHVQGGVGQDVGGTTNADNFRLRDLYINYCGLGVYVGGDDSNGYTIDALWGLNIGTLQPTPNAVIALDYTDLAGHILHDHSLAGGRVSDLYGQLSTGRAVLQNGLGRTTYLSCYQELGLDCYFVGGESIIIGGSIKATANSDGVLHLDRVTGRGIREVDSTGAVPISAEMTGQDGKSVFRFAALETGDPNFWALRYNYNTPTGFWALQHGEQAVGNAFMIAGSGAGTDPAPGWLAFDKGYLLGSTVAGMKFRGSSTTLTDRLLRQGLRRNGDAFEGTSSKTTLTSDGYRAIPWVAGQVVAEEYTPWGITASLYEPTANGTYPATGSKVFKCTVAGTTGGSEPNWATATIVGDTVVDNTATWTLVGFTPSMIETVGPGGGIGTQAMADANQTPTAAVYLNEVIKTTGLLTANRDLTLPTLTDHQGRRWVIDNTCTGAFSVVVKCASGTTVTVPNGKIGTVYVDSRGVTDGAISLRHTDTTINSATGLPTTIAAQNATGTTTTGGLLTLAGGTGTLTGGSINLNTGAGATTNGSIRFQTGGVTAITAALIPTGMSSISFASTGTSSVINQAGTSIANGSQLQIQAQNSTFAGSTGGNLSLVAGTGVTTNGVIRFGVFGSIGVTLTPASAAQSNYAVISTATSVLFNHTTIATNGVTGGNWTIQAQNATGTTTTGGSLTLTSGTGTTVAGATDIQTGGVSRLSFTPTLGTLNIAQVDTSNNTKGTSRVVNPVNVQTTDATVTTLASFTLASDTAVIWEATVIGVKSDKTAAGAYVRRACFRNNAGTVTQVGATSDAGTFEDNAAWDCTIDNSTTTIRVRVTGVAATTIQWTCKTTRLEVIS